jgi:hypothetical protein
MQVLLASQAFETVPRRRSGATSPIGPPPLAPLASYRLAGLSELSGPSTVDPPERPGQSHELGGSEALHASTATFRKRARPRSRGRSCHDNACTTHRRSVPGGSARGLGLCRRSRLWARDRGGDTASQTASGPDRPQPVGTGPAPHGAPTREIEGGPPALGGPPVFVPGRRRQHRREIGCAAATPADREGFKTRARRAWLSGMRGDLRF